MASGLLSEQLSRTTSSVCRSRPRGWWLGCCLVAHCVCAILAVSVAIAYASPPDPSWISGIYDDQDYDDVVGMVTDGTSVSDSGATPRLEYVLVRFMLRVGTAPLPHPTVGRRTIRGPPSVTPGVDLLLTSPPNASRQKTLQRTSRGIRNVGRTIRRAGREVNRRRCDSFVSPSGIHDVAMSRKPGGQNDGHDGRTTGRSSVRRRARYCGSEDSNNPLAAICRVMGIA
jgi:hypothetical protein